MRHLFDVLKEQFRTYDFHGCEFGRPEDAAQMADLIATDFGCSETDDWIGAQVRVRDVGGETLFSVAILLEA